MTRAAAGVAKLLDVILLVGYLEIAAINRHEPQKPCG
jgi:hypothetical protein